MKIKLVISLSMIATLGLPLSAQTPIPAAILEGNQANAQMGHTVASAGDINGDGYDDVVAGAWNYDNGQTDEGAAFIYMGSGTGIATTPAAILECNQSYAYLGSEVASAGDVNADGYDDVMVSAWYYDMGQTNEGAIFIYHGSATGIITTPAATLECNQSFAYFGCSVWSAGDVNGDGYDDVMAGARYYDNGQIDEGRVYVFLGSAGGVNITPIATMESNLAGARFGHSCAGVGDVNGDGYDDVAVGANDYTNGEYLEGKVYIYHGNAAGINTVPAVTFEGNQVGCHLGWSVAGAGDTNADGFSDVLIGSNNYTNGESLEGRAYIYRGSVTGVDPATVITIDGNQANGSFAYHLSGAGDTNNDGYDDIIVGGVNMDNGQVDEGILFVYQGSAAGVNTTAIRTMESDQANAWLGRCVGGGGDINGDGYDDLIGGALFYDNGQTDEGAVYIYYGQCGIPEICNSIDDDCDGFIDEGLYFDNYTDSDADGYGAGSPTSSCNPIPGQVTNNTDCNDAAAAIHPGAAELCNGIDDNCDGFIDEGGTPTVSIAATGATTFCKGGSVVLTATYFGTSLQWKKNGVNIAGAVGASYTVTATGDYTCESTITCATVASNLITVVVNKNPNASISAGGPTTFCAGGSVTLTEVPSPGCSYQWYKGAIALAGATSTTYIATTAGNYKCRVTKTATGCYKNSNTITVSVPCREESNAVENSFSIYPNPASDFITIETNLATEKTIYVTDALGQVLQTTITSENTITINLNNISSGVYFIRMEDGVQSVTEKFIKQ